MSDPAGERAASATRPDDEVVDDRPDTGDEVDEVLDGEIVDEVDAGPADDAGEPQDEERFVDGTPGRSDLAAERDEYLEALQRVKAEFDNYRRRTEAERREVGAAAAADLVGNLLPVLDACDAAVSHGAEEVEPVRSSLLDTLTKEGLRRLEPEGDRFDPNLHEAVMHEPGDDDETVVVEVLRAGYTWQERVLRPAMVKVRG
ncbi:MAG: nucleotide exchange factor GrpE [Acidimicrobiia bacterium]|nr:nucleotide exchange factor GrpE [Acidimicrobiia bacterium]